MINKLSKAFKEHVRAQYPKVARSLDRITSEEKQRRFYDLIIDQLIECFLLPSEEAKELSREELDRSIKLCKESILSREALLKDGSLRSQYNIPEQELQDQLEALHLLLDYWRSRRASDTKYSIIEIHLFIYFRWMDMNEIDDYDQRVLIQVLMEICDYHGAEEFTTERLLKKKKEIFSYMEADAEIEKALVYNIERKLKEDGVSKEEIRSMIQEAKTGRK